MASLRTFGFQPAPRGFAASPALLAWAGLLLGVGGIVGLGFGGLGVGGLGMGEARGAEPKLELRKGDRVTLIGNTLVDRLQHDGWLETLIQARHPDLELSFRNLGFPGDEIDVRPRSENFGSADQWLTKTQTSVVIAFFGYNEAFAGEAGLPRFRERLAKFIDATRAAKYDGQGPPRLALVSPIAHEDLKSPHLPDGQESNQRLLQYTHAMAEVAKEKGVPFVDAFAPTRSLYAAAAKPLTLNGIHLTSDGNRELARVIDRELFGEPAKADPALLERLRQAVVDKDFHWYNLYRTVDGYNVFGGRSKLAWFGQSNADVMRREMDIFNVMTQNRDKRVWAVARGGDLKVDDSNTPPLLEVKSNKPGPLEGGKYPFLGAEAAIEKMTIHKGMKVNLFASEEQFPDLVNPVQMAVDTDGRLWVATWPTYPHWNPKEKLADKIVILPDEDRDGKADKMIVFADNLNSVTGFELWGGGVLAIAAPDILFLKDTDGDDRADVRVRVLQGISAEDTHHTANALVIGPDGWLYYSHGIFHVDASETPTKTFRSTASGVFRFNPRTYEVEFHHPIGPNPHGNAFDQWGYQFATDGTSGTGNYVSVGKGVGAPKQWYQKRVRPVPAIGFLSSSHFPPEHEGNFLICNAIGVLGVLQHRVEYDGADINAIEVEPILLSSDPNFRPSDVEVGGDGALYVADWCNPLIGHMQHNIRDPNRDHSHGRVYRVTHEGRELAKAVKLKGKPLPDVLAAFYEPDDGVRYRARLELSGRDTAEVMAAIAPWAAAIGPNSAADEQALLEAVWVCEEHRVPNEELLGKLYAAKEPRVRAAATRALGNWASRVKKWEAPLLAAARDGHPLVRAEAVKAAVSFGGLAAAEAIFEASNRPTDAQLDFVLKYARGKINVDAVVQDALKSGQKLSPAAQQYVLRNASAADLLKMERGEAVYAAILSRTNIRHEDMREALSGLAKLRGVSGAALLLDMISEQDAGEQDAGLAALGALLAEQPVAQLRAAGLRLEKLAANGKTAAARRAAYAAWISADGSAHDALLEAGKSKTALRDLLEATPLVPSDEVRAGMYEYVRGLLFELPAGLKREMGGAVIVEHGVQVEYFHPNPPDVAIETLARLKPKAAAVVPEIVMDVPILAQRDQFALRFTGSILIDKPGKHTFFTNSDDGSRLYVGGQLVVNNDGLHGPEERKGDVQLKVGAHPLVVTYFDNGGGDHFEVFWAGPGFSKQKIPAERLSIAGDDTLHDVAIRVLKLLPGHEAQKFVDLATVIQSGRNRASAIRALQAIPPAHWSPRHTRSLADNLVGYLTEIPARARTGPAAQDAVALAKAIADKLPPADAQALRDRLENLDVRVIAVGTVIERMNFDKETIVVEAGKPVEFRFTNTDNMPHNFAIVLPGALEEVGSLAEKTAEAPDAMARQYVPKTDKILLASRLLQPTESQAVAFEAPKAPGVYPYVCTYPGHWRRMYGALYVVADMKKYEADPPGYLAASGLEVKDELLKYLARNTEWKFEDLADAVKQLAEGKGEPRSFDVGRQLFKVSACVGCHKINNEGSAIGPDLGQLDPKRAFVDVLRDVLEPSININEKYQSYNFELENGKLLSGLILEENDDTVKVVTNPLAPDKPTILKKSEIAERAKSKVSLMPQGVLNKFTREEILDLLAYVYAKGDKNSKLFQPAGAPGDRGAHQH